MHCPHCGSSVGIFDGASLFSAKRHCTSCGKPVRLVMRHRFIFATGMLAAALAFFLEGMGYSYPYHQAVLLVVCVFQIICIAIGFLSYELQPASPEQPGVNA